MWILFLLSLTINAQADYQVTAKGHCGPVYTIVDDGHGGKAVHTEDECVTTPNDWKDR